MRVSSTSRSSLSLSAPLAGAVGLGGVGAIFATYWDEAWHTDIGRDSFWTPAHAMLYGSMAVVGLAIAWWGLQVLSRSRSLRSSLNELPVVAAALGGATVLAAAPIDNAWHEAFGRDSVEWSPPHMLVIFAATAIAFGALAGIAPEARYLRSAASVLLLADAATVVFEYEADVPQFSEALYLPILLITGVLVAGVIRGAVPLRAPVTIAVVAYAVLRLAVSLTLILLGRSTPDLPLAVLGFAAYDLPLRSQIQRSAAAGILVSGIAWSTSAVGLESQPAASVGLIALPVVLGGLIVLLASRILSRPVAAVVLVAMASLGLLANTAQRADAHDPGQGQKITTISLSATTGPKGHVAMTASFTKLCRDAAPVVVVARRAGQALTAALKAAGPCSFHGELRLPEPGRWFMYAEFNAGDRAAEAWLPIEAGDTGTLTESRALYFPAGTQPGRKAEEILVGLPIYTLGLSLLGLGMLAQRGSRVRPKR